MLFRYAIAVPVAILAMGGVQANAEAMNNVEIVKNLYEAIQNADRVKLREVLSSEHMEDPPSYSGKIKGPDAYLPVALSLRKALGDFKVDIIEIIDASPKYVVRTKMSGKHQDDFLGVPATGKDISFNTIDIHELNEGKILRSWHIEDFATAMKQMQQVK
jgi:steroid delta-isomerase-like uncharacterized protein